jgi:predicted Zn-dependent peptidase
MLNNTINLNRTIAPVLQQIDKIDFVKPLVFDVAGTTKLFHMKEVPNETSRLDLYFDAGTARGEKGIASFVNGLLLSGTNTKTSVEINGEIDALGGFFESGISSENAVLSVYALKENLLPILKILVDAIDHLAFQTHEVEEIINDRKQKFKVNMEKVSFLAQREFQSKLFNNSLYGRITDEKDFDLIEVENLKKFHKKHYLEGLQKVVIIGDLTDADIHSTIELVRQWSLSNNGTYEKDLENLPGEFHVDKTGAVQSALRIGRILFNKTHEDYHDFIFLNTILGDYFGSRLMSNIREDKGYTYGIGSMVAELHETGYFLIATEVGKDVREATIVEIKKELKLLQEKPIGIEEVELVRNYLLGQLLKSADGPYSMADLYLSVEPYGLELDFYNQAIESINTITPKRIQELAKKYLNWEDFTIVSAG